MNKTAKIFSVILTIFILCIIVLKVPAPMSKEQMEFDENIMLAERLKSNHKCEDALKILETLNEEYPSTAIYLELVGDGCYAQLKQKDKVLESCLNSKLTEYMPARAAICAKQLAEAKKFDEALSIWDKNIQDKPEEIFPYSQISSWEQRRVKANMQLKTLFTQSNNLTEEIKKQSIENIEKVKQKH